MDVRRIRSFASSLPKAFCAAGVLALVSAAPSVAADEDAFRKMLEGGGGAGGAAAPAKPKAAKPARPAAPRESCDQKFATLKATVDTRDKNFTKTCFIDERCTWADKCAYSKVVHAEYGRLAKIASSCTALPNNREWADKYAKWEASGVEVIEYNCRPR